MINGSSKYKSDLSHENVDIWESYYAVAMFLAHVQFKIPVTLLHAEIHISLAVTYL
jgi:hypothetical protein